MAWVLASRVKEDSQNCINKYLAQKHFRKAVGRYRHLALIGIHPQSQYSMVVGPFAKCFSCESVVLALWYDDFVCFSAINENIRRENSAPVCTVRLCMGAYALAR